VARAPSPAWSCLSKLLVVDGNPLEDISVTERISWVIFKGERVYNRAGLFVQE